MKPAQSSEGRGISTLNVVENPPVPYYVKACALGIPAYLIGIHFWTWVFNVRYFLAGWADFRSLYTAGYLIRTGHRHQLYEFGLQEHFQNAIVDPSNVTLPFNHLAYESLLFAPLSFVTYRTAYFIFLGVNLVTLALCFRLLRPWTRNLAKVYRWLPIALFAAYLPIAAALIQGQDSILLLAAFTGLFVLLEHDQHGWAGAVLGLAMFKFQFALPVALVFLFWRRWKFIAGFAVSAGALLSISVWLVGLSQMRTFVRLLSTISAISGPTDYLANAVSPNHMPNLRGLIFGLADDHFPTKALQVTIAIASAVLLLWVVKRCNIAYKSSASLVVITVTVLVSYHSNIHDLSILLVPILCTLDRYVLRQSNDAAARWLTISAASAFCAPVAESFFSDRLYLASLPILILLVVLIKHLTSDSSERHAVILKPA